MRQVLLDHLPRELPCCNTEVAPRPEMATPVALLQARKLLKELARRAAFDPAHDVRGRPLRRRRHQYVYVILADDAPQDLDFQHLARLAHQLAQAQGDVAFEHVVAVLRHEDEVVFDPVLEVYSKVVDGRVRRAAAETIEKGVS